MSKKKKKGPSINQVLTQMVLDVFEHGGNQPLNYKQVCAKLNINDPEARETILEILEEEAFKQVLKKVSPGKFQLIKLKLLLKVLWT